MSRPTSASTPRAAATPSSEPAPRRQPFSPRALIDLLMFNARTELSNEDLAHIASGGLEYAELAAGNAAHVVEDVCAMVLHESSNQPGAGSFQDAQSVAHLLGHLQAQFQTLEGVVSAVGWATSELGTRGKT